MTQPSQSSRRILEKILSRDNIDVLKSRISKRMPSRKPLPERVHSGNDFSEKGIEKRIESLRKAGVRIEALSSISLDMDPMELKGNIENFVGYAAIPVGVVGPLRVNGLNAEGDFYIPMAATEGALVASYHRGAYVISQSGGASVMCLEESVTRAPCFVFRSMSESGEFASWVLQGMDSLQEIVSRTSRYCVLLDIDTAINGKNVYLNFKYYTGDAAGQNMVTAATDEICRALVEESPVKPETWFVEGNISGDKKVTMQSFINSRGKKVVAETTVDKRLIERVLNTSAKEMERYCKISTHGGILSGSIGVQGHFANALAAIFIACGQDAASVSEAAVGLTDMEVNDDGDLYVSVSLPNLIVGTVGGGTHLPTASECLGMMDCRGEGKSAKFAEICAAAVLAGEISIIGALSAGEFGSAHRKYRRKA